MGQKRVHLVALVIMCLVVLRNARGIPLRAHLLSVDLCFVNASCCGEKGGFLNLFVLYLEAASQHGESAVAGVGKKELRLLASNASDLLFGIQRALGRAVVRHLHTREDGSLTRTHGIANFGQLGIANEIVAVSVRIHHDLTHGLSVYMKGECACRAFNLELKRIVNLFSGEHIGGYLKGLERCVRTVSRRISNPVDMNTGIFAGSHGFDVIFYADVAAVPLAFHTLDVQVAVH